MDALGAEVKDSTKAAYSRGALNDVDKYHGGGESDFEARGESADRRKLARVIKIACRDCQNHQRQFRSAMKRYVQTATDRY